MKTASLTKALTYSDSKPKIDVLMETETSKEIRIAFKKGHIMKEHKTPFPIVVEVFKGSIDFGVNGVKYHLSEGNLIALEGDIPHDLKANKDSIVRLTLSKKDNVKRVQNIKTS